MLPSSEGTPTFAVNHCITLSQPHEQSIVIYQTLVCVRLIGRLPNIRVNNNTCDTYDTNTFRNKLIDAC